MLHFDASDILSKLKEPEAIYHECACMCLCGLPRPLRRLPLNPAVRRRGVEVQLQIPAPSLPLSLIKDISLALLLQSRPRPATSTGKQPDLGHHRVTQDRLLSGNSWTISKTTKFVSNYTFKYDCC